MRFPWSVSVGNLPVRLRSAMRGHDEGVLSRPLSELTGSTRTQNINQVMRYTHNDLGEVLDNPKHRVTDLRILHPADLVACQRSLLSDTHWMGYWHFAIVESVNIAEQTVRVIHYQPVFDDTYDAAKDDLPSKFKKGTIKMTTMPFTKGQFWLVELDHRQCLPASVVLSRAHSRLQESDYNIFNNNCESFAFWCKTGSSQSTQSKTATSVAVQQGTRAVVKFTVKKAAERVVAKGLLGRGICRASSIGAQASRLTRVTGLFSLVDAAMGAGFTVREIFKAKKKLRDGQIDHAEYRQAVSTLLAVRTGDVSCSMVGTLAGSALGGPAGAFIGGALGSAVGTVLGSATASAVVRPDADM